MVKKTLYAVLLIILGGLVLLDLIPHPETDSPRSVQIVPAPLEIRVGGGRMRWTRRSRLRWRTGSLMPLAKILAAEIEALTGALIQTAPGPAVDGDLILGLDTDLAREEYVLEIGERAGLRAGSYAGAAHGSVTLLQLLDPGRSRIHLPHMTLRDRPRSGYRGLLVDVARRPHDIEILEQLVLLCRWYKINRLQLHLTDTQAFTFPSTAFPGLATPGRHYTTDQLRGLERFARDRGVTLVPELDVPGHAEAMISVAPGLFGIHNLRRNRATINMGREKVYEALDTLVGEMAAVFQTSTDFHMGGDEAYLGWLAGDPDVRAYMRRHRLADVDELYRHFLVRMNEIVKRHGKRMMVWEGFAREGEVEIPRDIGVFAWETRYQLPQDLLSAGFSVINASWKPCYVTPELRWDPRDIYGWNVFRWENWWNMAPSYVPIQLEPSDRVIGAQMCAWEMSGDMELAALRPRLPALAERTWLSGPERTFEDFQARWGHADSLFQQLLCPVRIEADGLMTPGYAGPVHNRENWFEDRLTLELTPTRERIELRITLDGSEPGPSSLRPRKPITLRETTSLTIRAFTRTGEPLGYPFQVVYEHHPVRARVDGLITHTPHARPARPRSKFGEKLKVALESTAGGGIRFTLDGSDPGISSPLYFEPVELSESGVISARVFEKCGRPRGEIWRRKFEKVDQQSNLTSFAPVSASGFFGGHKPGNVVDGIIDRADTWRASRDGAGWLQVDLGEPFRLDGVRLYFYWNRWHDPVRYRLDLSEDGVRWRTATDMRRNRRRALPEGFHHAFPPATVRFLRVTVLAAGDRSPELVEIRACAATGEPVS